VSSSPCQLDAQDFLFRFLHRANVNPNGTVSSGAFSLRRDSAISLGIEKLIPTTSLDAFCALKPGQGLAKVRLDEIQAVGLNVQPEAESAWGEFANAHAVLTGYDGWTNDRKETAARALRNAANRWGVVKAPAK